MSLMDVDQITYEEESKKNDLNSDLPIIAFCPDWRYDAKGNPVYIRFIYDNFCQLIQNNGCKMHLMRFEDEIDDIKHKIHGWLVPGGRDLDPKFYGQENTHSKVEAEDSARRWNFCKGMLEKSCPKMPIFGICYGFQILNVLLGGDLIQDLENGYKNHFQKIKMVVEPGTQLEKALKGAKMVGQCYHHQGLGKVPECLKVNCWDELDKYPHGFEYNGTERNIMAILWHPEASFRDTRNEKLDKANTLVFCHFFDQCREYKTSLNKQ